MARFSITTGFTVLLLMIGALMVSPANAQQPPPDQVIGNWKLTCDGGPCRAFFNIRQGEDIVVTWTLMADPERDQQSSLVKVPTGVAIPPGLRIYADDAVFFDAPFQVCEPDGCTAIYAMDQAMVDAMRDKATMRVAFVRYGASDTMAYEVPIEGMTEALSALR